MFTQSVISGHPATVVVMVEVFKLLGNKESRSHLIDDHIESLDYIKKQQTKCNRLRLGHFTTFDFMQMVHRYSEKHELKDVKNNAHVIDAIIARLSEYGIVTKSGIPGTDEYQVNELILEIYVKNNLLDNLLFGLNYTLNKYMPSIPAVNVVSGDGTENCGTGLYIGALSVGSDTSYIVTNGHVLEGKTISSITAGEYSYRALSEPIMSGSADIAAIAVKPPEVMQAININSGQTKLLDDVVTVGYPRIPLATDQYALVHKGEVNGHVDTITKNRFMVISCNVSPGNSGGPVLDTLGQCVGMVTQSNYADYADESPTMKNYNTIYHMAIPTSEIIKFLKTLKAE